MKLEQLLAKAKVALPSGGSRTTENRTLSKRKERERNRKLKYETRAVLMAHEYIRNGQNLEAAYRKVTGYAPRHSEGSIPLQEMLRSGTNRFLAEVDSLLKRAFTEVAKDSMLGTLWNQSLFSPLDLIDDEGKTLPISELKKLPRWLQSMLVMVEQSTTNECLAGPDGKPIVDDNGNPYYVTRHYVKVKVSDKDRARELLAQMMRWVGQGNINVNVQNVTNNYAQIVRAADTRKTRLAQTYENAKQIEHDATPTPTTT